MAQDLRDPLRGQLARSTRARSVVHQPFLPAKEQHASSPYKKTHGSKTVGLSKQAIPYKKQHSNLACVSWFGFFPRMSVDGFKNPFLFREFSFFQLGIDKVPIDGYLETTSARRNQLQIANLLFVGC